MEKNLTPIKILFISISGNTRAFAQKLVAYAQKVRQADPTARLVEITEIGGDNQFIEMQQPFTVLVPTYLGGGNGINNGNQEIMTNEMRETLADNDNYRWCYGVIGSGNRNFNAQFGLTAKQYAAQFKIPVIDFYEMRGTQADVKRIYQELNDFQIKFEQHLSN
ncbi:class Ib ribonucleoside-diphosphate reductase assembly flavoprotein NrdI [Liquorilactobacillus sicerae]|uniref:class Ib ribonucleoside-diphosphate reductase assembly flavoprotein NrdI n=1 Tax=Liquorilactobacillus sicerae TaxID=1416943 RepID=UPI0024800CE5|nr:class Ib ribonucleoside-diphosphate reductase assembly flavoprotein NrdI [Liquorilactobacillus sicerae]